MQPSVRRNQGIGEEDARSAQKNEELAGPEQDVQQAAALKIGKIFRIQADVEGLARAFLDEGSHRSEVDGR